MTQHEHEREHYRIEYPTAARPRFLVAGEDREVLDLCEQGLRYRAASDERRKINDEIEGIVRFRRGEEVRVQDTGVRLIDREVALRLRVGVSAAGGARGTAVYPRAPSGLGVVSR